MSFKIKALKPINAILIIESGFVIQGMCQYMPDTNEVQVTEGNVLRVWGTSRGLGQLAAQGPQPESKIDPITTTWVPYNKIIMTMEVTYKGEWKDRG